MMAFASFGPHGFVCPTMSEHGGPRGSSGHLIGRMIMRASVVTGSYGLIVLLPVGQKPRPTLTGLRYRWTARLGRARASAILSDSECCREMSFISNLSVFVLPWIEEVPFGANFVLGCSFPYSCLLKAAARSTVDFPRRCPFSGIVRVPFRDEESAVISRYFKSRYRDFAPSLSAKVPNRGVDWSSRPRRACYPWGNFSVTSSPQQ